MDVLEFLYDYFQDGLRAAALIRRRRPFAVGVLGLLAGGVGLFTALGGGLFFLPGSWATLLLLLLTQAAVVFLSAAALHQMLDMSGARGDAGALFVHLGLSELAWLAAVPMVLIARVLAPGSSWPVGLSLAAVWTWSLSLKARGVHDEYGVGWGRAWLTIGLLAAAVAAFCGLALTLTIAALVIKALSA